MKRVLACLLLFPVLTAVQAQAPFTAKSFDVRVEKDLVYGADINYAGIPIELTLDLYKPVGDNNLHRPLLVMVHGGVWLAGCKTDEEIMAREMAQRGYVVASVNYRKGWHKDDYVPNAINPDIFPGGNCLYPADSAEIIRAIYRGQQDVKGAIRWLKARALQDSTCNHSVLVGGSSAGAFLALTVGLLDRPAEKPDACFALPDAPVPASNVSNCYDQNCTVQTILPSGDALKRPDLGSIDGSMNQNGFNADVIGVCSFFGGLPYEALSKEWLKGPDTPALYLFHQTCDGIVPFGYGQPFITISANCNLGFTPWHYNYPHFFGNGAIATFLQALPAPPLMKTDFVECPVFNPGLALFECVRYNDNGSYHWVANPPERAQKMADFFSPVIVARMNQPSCLVAAAEPVLTGLSVFPNPFQEQLTLENTQTMQGPARVSITDVSGKVCWESVMQLEEGRRLIDPGKKLPPGFYVLRVQAPAGVWVKEVVRI